MSQQPPPQHVLPPGVGMPGAPMPMMGPPPQHLAAHPHPYPIHLPTPHGHAHGLPPPQMHPAGPAAFHHPRAMPSPQQFMQLHGGHLVNPMGPILPPPGAASPATATPPPPAAAVVVSAVSTPSPAPPPGLATAAPLAAAAQPQAAAASTTPQRVTRPARASSTGNGSTPSRKKNTPQRALGERLPEGSEVTYRLEGGQQPPYGQLEVTPITLLNSPPVYQRGSLIAVNHNYICYVVKGNMIRVINIFSAKRALLRGHTKSIMDMRFCEGHEDILASVATDGRLLVWRITEETDSATDNGEESGIGHELIAAVRMEGDRWLERIIWHPALTHVLATAGNDQHAYVWDLNRIRQHQQTVEDGKNIFVYSSDESVAGVVRINVGAPVTDLAFAPRGDALATAANDGRVQVWSASGGASPTSPSLSWVAHRDEAWGVAFSDDGATLITGGLHNAELAVWQLDEEQVSEPVLRQKINLLPPPNGSIFNHILLDPSGRFLFVANAKSTTFAVLHLQSEPEPRFDYISEFSVAQPILSLTVISRGAPTPSKPDVEVDLYCLQTKAIQMYHLNSTLCYTPQPASVTPSPSQPSATTTAPKSTPSPPPGLGDIAVSQPPSSEPANVQLPSPAASQNGLQSPSPSEESSHAKTSLIDEPAPVPEAVATPVETVAPAKEDVQESLTAASEAAAPSDTTPPAETSALQPSESASKEQSPTDSSQNAEENVESTDRKAAPAAEEEPSRTEENVKTDSDNDTETKKTEPVEDTVPVDTTATSGTDNEQVTSDGKQAEEESSAQESSVAEVETSPTPVRAEEADEPPKLPEGQEPTEQSPNVEENAQDNKADGESSTLNTQTSGAEEELPQPQAKTATEPDLAPALTSTPSTKPHAVSPSGRGKQSKKYKQTKSENRLSQPALLANQGGSQAGPKTAEPEQESSQQLPTSNLHAELKRLENSLLNSMTARMERSLQQFADRQVAKAEKERAERDKGERDRQQRLLNTITQTITTSLNAIPQQIEKTVQKEMQSALVPALGRALVNIEKNIAKNITEELRPHLTQRAAGGNWEKDLPPRLASEVASRLPSASDIATALQTPVRHALESSFRSSFQDSIIPSFQGSCQAMFQQIYGTVLPGLKQTVEEAIEPGMERLAGVDLREALQSLTAAANDMRELSARNAELYQTIAQSPSAGRRFGDHPTPSFSDQPVSEAQLLQLLERDAFEQAFATALSERGVEAVRHLLQWIEPQGFFESGHTLSQIVMASLIHRVALDLHHDTANKLDWLSHLLLHFHPHDPSVAAHAQHILHHTINHLNSLQAAYPHQPITISIRLLIHTASSLVSSPPPHATSFSIPYGAPI